MTTIHDVINYGWIPPGGDEHVYGLVQVRDYVVIVTSYRIWKVDRDSEERLIFHLLSGTHY